MIARIRPRPAYVHEEHRQAVPALVRVLASLAAIALGLLVLRGCDAREVCIDRGIAGPLVLVALAAGIYLAGYALHAAGVWAIKALRRATRR